MAPLPPPIAQKKEAQTSESSQYPEPRKGSAEAGQPQPSSTDLVTQLCPTSYANEVSDGVPFR